MKFPVLIGDIGGTNARFQILADAHCGPESFPYLLTADFDTVEEAIQTGILEKTALRPRSIILAAAGPVKDGKLELTNCAWTIRPDRLMGQLAVDEVILLNDFEAQALAATIFQSEDILKIGGGEPRKNGSRVVVGPGTGLGVAGLIHGNDMWSPVSGEGGHVDIGPQSARDFEIWPFIQQLDGRISAEHVISGRGIVHIYRALCNHRKAVVEFGTPEEITAAALDGFDRLATEAVELFCVYLGRVAGDLAMTFMARGGVFIAGGICQKIVPLLAGSGFRREFENKTPHGDLLKVIPTYVVTHPAPALAGLTAFARLPSHFGLKTTGRHWLA